MAIKTVFGSRDNREKKSLANREYYKTLIESKKEAAFLSDTEGDLHLLNKKAQQITGFSEEDIRDLHLRDIFITVKDTENPFDTRQFSEFSTKILLLDSRRYLIPVFVDFREIEGQKFLCTCAETSDKEALPAKKEIPEKMPKETAANAISVTGFDSSAAWPGDFEHKVRNLLNNMLGYGSILSRDQSIAKDKKLSGSLDNLMKSGNQLKHLFNQFSIGETDSYEVAKKTFDLSAILQKTLILLDPLTRQNNIEIRINQDKDLNVFTDEHLLLELLSFLLEKAILFARSDHVKILAGKDLQAGTASITIDNLGQDIPQAVINFIKRENSRGEYDLGNPIIVQNPELKTMLSILNRIDGRIFFTTAESMGEIAKIVIPLSSGRENIDELSVLEEAIRKKNLNVLIVEDEKFTARILEMYLEEISSVSLAFSGNEALNITEIFYSKGIVFDAIVMDIGLPRPWDGILLKQEMEKRWPEYQEVPFLAQTAFTAKSYSDRISETRFRGFLLKPVNRIDVLRFLLKYCK